MKNDYKITEAKLELMQKIINAHLTKEELRELTEYTCGLIQNREEGEKKK